MFEENLKNFLDENKKLKQLPSKWKFKVYALAYLASKLDHQTVYSEYAINIVLLNWHVFNDCATLRRELYNNGFLTRTTDGKEYRLSDNPPTPEDLINLRQC